jgi:hypothetical protein
MAEVRLHQRYGASDMRIGARWSQMMHFATKRSTFEVTCDHAKIDAIELNLTAASAHLASTVAEQQRRAEDSRGGTCGSMHSLPECSPPGSLARIN